MSVEPAEQKIRHTVLFVSVGLAYGGAESYYVKLAKILLPDYRIVAVVCSKQLADKLGSLGVKVECLQPTFLPPSAHRYLFALVACWRMVLHQRPKIVHLNGQPESYLAVFLRLIGMRLLTTRHTPFTDLYLKEGSRLPIAIKRRIVLFSLRIIKRTICVSQLLQRQLEDVLPEGRTIFIPTWITDDFLELYIRPLPSVPLRVLFVGRVVRNKGILDAIEAVQRCPNVHLTVVGEGDEMRAAKNLASGLKVSFAGFQSDCKPMYRTSDLLIFTSPEGFEGLPQVPLEAMAMGLPCLASDISSILEIAGERGGLATYRQGDIEDLAEKLNLLRTDKLALIDLGKAGRLEIDRRFTESAVAHLYRDEFRLALL